MLERIKIITSRIWAFILPGIRTFLKEYGPILSAAAISAVKAAAQAYLGQSGMGAAKRDMAFNQIADTLKSEGYRIGIQVTAREVNKAIEMALDYIEAEG